MREESVPKIIYIMGIDGSGKTTVSEHLEKLLRERGYKVNVMWLRFNHVITKPLLAICRLLGLTQYKDHGGIRVGYHNFYRSRIVSWLFVLLQYFDAVRVKYLRILPKMRGGDSVLILDRYIYDILIDVMVDTRIENLDEGLVGKAFRKLIPEEALSLLVDRDLAKVLEVRPEGRVDRNFELKYQYYKKLSESDLVVTIKNEGQLDDLLKKVEIQIGLSQ